MFERKSLGACTPLGPFAKKINTLDRLCLWTFLEIQIRVFGVGAMFQHMTQLSDTSEQLLGGNSEKVEL